jgi:two-component system response regulator YesN
VLEYIIWAERIAFEAGAINYGFSYRKDYLDIAMGYTNYEELRQWFLGKMTDICCSIRNQKEAQSDSVVKRAMAYIEENYSRDISLDEVSREVNISPYYFSKLFKEESNENFIEYLTRIRIEKAKEMLENPEFSIKEVSLRSGYADPNYFSRIFKKQTDMTPREYKAKYGR